MFATRSFTRTLAGAAGTLLFAGLCIGGATAPAHARDAAVSYGLNAEGQRTAAVSVADLNLATVQGRATMEARVRVAARAVCSAMDENKLGSSDASRCFHEAVRNARAATLALAQAKAEKTSG